MVTYDTSVSAAAEPAGDNSGSFYDGSVGVLIKASGGGAPSATTPLLWAGQYQDPSTGLYYMRACWYDPGPGEFLSVDPDFSESLDAYGYADEKPVDATDPSGMTILLTGGEGGGAVSSAPPTTPAPPDPAPSNGATLGTASGQPRLLVAADTRGLGLWDRSGPDWR